MGQTHGQRRCRARALPELGTKYHGFPRPLLYNPDAAFGGCSVAYKNHGNGGAGSGGEGDLACALALLLPLQGKNR